MGIGTSSTRTTSKSTGTLAGGRKEKSFIIKRQIACWRCCSSNILVQRRDAGAREHLCSQQDSSSVGGGWQEGSAAGINTGSTGHQGTPRPREVALSTSDSKWSVCAQDLHRGKEKPSGMTAMGRTGTTNILQIKQQKLPKAWLI